ncbi:MAG: hypothetical protein IJW27_05735 [Clostridia bacterium]|nr:hypothetical protein [Clostridia bacterium]
MDFKEYISSLPNQNRLAILNAISKHGDPNGILTELFGTPPCVSTKKHDIRVSNNFFLWYKKKTLLSPDQLYLFKFSDLKYIYHCEEGGIGGCSIGLIYADGNETVRNGLDLNDSVAVFEELSRRVTGFADTPSTFGGGKDETVIFTDVRDPKFSYRISGRQLVSVKERAFKEPNVYVIVDDIDKIMWCTQYYAADSDADDTYALELYVLGKKKPERLFCTSTRNAFDTALALKDHIPHLLYGHNREYERLFRENPQGLMELAKSKK